MSGLVVVFVFTTYGPLMLIPVLWMTKGHKRKFYYSAVNVYNVSGIEPVTENGADNCEQTLQSETGKKKSASSQTLNNKSTITVS